MATSNFVCSKPNKLLRLGLDELSKEDNFGFVRSRIGVVRLLRHLLKERHDQFQGLPTFASLVDSIEGLDGILDECELVLRRYVVGELSADELDALIHDDIVSALNDDVSDLRPMDCADDQGSEDAQVLMERTWADLMPHTRALQDLLQSVSDDDMFAMPSWRLKFEREEAEHLSRNPSGRVVVFESK
ncbi:hypothetical protein [Stenotrophomonas sp. VV52]|uniref:hypothetical protein n=1 Tax=Stenotrophomonas sp. VV52 TaxID=2066958 RepID=UPI0011AF220A|nr:hypothetical protein [Stenotrophomonas sp. VV52]